MSNFHKKNRSFRTLDLIGLIALVGVVCSVSGVILAQAMQDDKPARARSAAEALAKQIRGDQQNKSSLSRGSGRSPASNSAASVPTLTSGSMGHDPWGRPFHYFVRKTEKPNGHGVVRIYVWSDGPDGRPNTDPEFIEHANKSRIALRGDDIGFLEEYQVD